VITIVFVHMQFYFFRKGQVVILQSISSERASETNNFGQKLRDGANINRSLLALANCINALGKQNKKGLAYVPYRNRYFQFGLYYYGTYSVCGSYLITAICSKLTRILKDGLSGNSRTVMVATISPADDQYHHTTNTLKYADRAKEIKTHVHVSDNFICLCHKRITSTFRDQTFRHE
jgi:kinesin family member 18/19